VPGRWEKTTGFGYSGAIIGSREVKEININKTSSGIGIGTVLAIILSWTSNHSVLWAILHAFCSWFYVIYWCLFK
jgi:hypothetical protein